MTSRRKVLERGAPSSDTCVGDWDDAEQDALEAVKQAALVAA